MFYSQDILQKRGGKFGIIWIAATRASDLTKRDYSAVNVARTCEEIISHLTGQSRARYDRGRFPRFSLYLSAQLMFGVTLVHGKHAEYLYGDAMTLQSKFIPKRRVAPGGLIIISTKDIDMRTSTRPTEALRLEDPLDMYRPGLVELDPEFGRLNIPEDMIEPDFLPFGPEMIHFPLAPPTPDWWPGRGRDTRKPRSPHSPGSPPGYDPNQVKDKNDISLPEHDWPSLDQMPGKDDDDLQPPQVGDPLMSSLSSPENGDKEGPTQPPMEQPSRKRPDREKSDKPPKRKKPSDPREPEARQDLPRDVEPLPMVESPPSDERRPPGTDTESPENGISPSQLKLPPLPEDELRTPPRRPRPGRGPMIDRDTQLSREEVRDNLGHPERTLAPLVPANPKPLPTADQLFTQPCIRVHNPALLRPWQRKPGLLPREHPLEGEDAWWSPEEERSRGGPDVSKERLRDPTFDESLPGPKRPRMDVSGESIDTSSASDQVSDHGPMPGEDIPPRRRPTDLGPTPYDSIPEEPGPEPDMPELIPPEEPVVSPQQTTPPQVTPPQEKTPSSESFSSKESLCEPRPKDQVRFSPLHLVRSRVSREELNSKLAKALEDHDSTTFDTQAPPEQVDRATAAHFFYICLAFNKEQKIQLHQEMPYGDIVIEKGTRFAAMQAAAEASRTY